MPESSAQFTVPVARAARARLRLHAAALAGLALGAAPALAQSPPETARPEALGDPIRANPGDDAPGAKAAPASATASSTDVPVDFEADRIEYDDKADVVTATGNVILKRDDQSLRADAVHWDRKSGTITATGHVRAVDADGNESFADKLTTTDALTTGALDNLLIVLREGGRLVSKSAQRDANGDVALSRAAYTSCDVVDDTGCPQKPIWRMTAHRAVYRPKQSLFRMYGARMVLLGAVKIPLPTLTVATDGRSVPGLLIPNVTTSASNGVGLNAGYFVRLGPNRDLTLTGYVYTQVKPMASVEYRALTDLGAYQFTGYATASPVISQSSTTGAGQEQLRGYVDSSGRFQLSPAWSIAYSGRLASDRTFLQRYQISNDDVLRSTITAQHITDNSFLSITGWAFETLRPGERQGQVPIALPEIDYRRRIADPWLGGMIALEANSLAISRSAGQDTQRAFTSAQWSLSRLTGWGQKVTFTTLLRGDAYHTTDSALTDTTVYRGVDGWHTRGEALAAVDVTWPLIGAAFGGTQILTPRVQVVAVPPARNAVIPNEDSRTVELGDDNLFALSRFPGYDRIEDGVRVTYGLDWLLERPGWRASATVGQSVRLTNNSTSFVDGSGLYDKVSDVVGRAELRYRDFFRITHRFRLDKSSFAFRRNEIDATIGSDRNYIELGYARVNRQLAIAADDLADSNEARGSVRAALARYWSIFGSGVFDLSKQTLVSGAAPKAFQPLRTRLGVSYQSDCFEFDLTWRKDYVTIGDAEKGSSFMVHFSLRNIGIR